MITGNIQMYKWLLLSSFFSALTIISIKYSLQYKNKYLLLVTTLSEICLIYSYINMLQNGDILTGFSFASCVTIKPSFYKIYDYQFLLLLVHFAI